MYVILIAAPLLAAFLLRTMFSWTLIALAAAGIPVLLLGVWLGLPAPVIFWVWNLGLILVSVLDYFLSAKPRQFAVSRQMDQVLSLGAPNQVMLALEYRGSHHTRVIVQDEAPAEFSLSQRRLRAKLEPRYGVNLTYFVTPSKRGLYMFDRVHLRYRCRFGLLVRSLQPLVTTVVKVYPDVLAIRRFELLARAGRLADLGIKTSRLRGAGTDFESVREYVPGDEFRRINWQATARRGKPQSNEYQVDRSQQIFFLLDAGRLMATRADQLARLDHAINAALMLAYVAANRGDRLGALVFGSEIQGYLPPGVGRGQVGRLAEFLYPVQPELAEADYARALAFFATRNRKRSLVCLFTDLIDETSSGLLLSHLPALAPVHIPLCLALRDPLLDAAARAEITNSDMVYAKAVAEQVLSARARARLFLERHGVIVIDVTPSELSVALVNKYLELKERGRI